MSQGTSRGGLTLAQYRVLQALDEEGGFSAAAEALGISQPSVSSQLRAIEDRMRMRVFDRDGHQLSLTPLGRQLMPRIRGLTALADELDTLLTDHLSNRTGRLALGYSTHQFVMPVLADFRKRYPGVGLSAGCMATADLLDKLERGLFHAAFVTLRDLPPELSVLTLRRERIALMTPRGHPLAQQGAALGWDTLATLPLIAREPASGTRQCFDACARARGLRYTPVLELGSWESMRAAVRSGIGLGVVMAGEVEPGDDVDLADLDDPDLWVHHALVTTPHLRSLASVDALFAIAEKYRVNL